MLDAERPKANASDQQLPFDIFFISNDSDLIFGGFFANVFFNELFTLKIYLR